MALDVVALGAAKKYADGLSMREILPEDIQNAINEALAQAKESGEFKGDPGAKGDPGEPGEPGDDYILTEEDRQEITNNIINELPKWTGGVY